MNAQDIIAWDKDVDETIRHAQMFREQHRDGLDRMDGLAAVVNNMRSLHAQMISELDNFINIMESAKSGSNVTALKPAA